MVQQVLDDRKRKLILGDHSGEVVVLNYLNGVRMKDCGANPHSSDVVALLYSEEDKVIISASWDRSVLIHEELEPEAGAGRALVEGKSSATTVDGIERVTDALQSTLLRSGMPHGSLPSAPSCDGEEMRGLEQGIWGAQPPRDRSRGGSRGRRPR